MNDILSLSNVTSAWNLSDDDDDVGNQTTRHRVDLGAAVKIVLYSIIFVLSITGNALVIVTLVQNKRMRTITNVFLLNLSVSDLLLTIFCMPFTLTGHLLQDWIFGGAMCTLIMYFQ
ncbi:PREDICTED: cholecystokinin receptor type A-like, partial [Priapulus caudatus]|uniref:Cholecystokinin receptor type A-like n=1 Tax=Priapulus caudatus TaxID=37621 RepID=A0ABM1F124_PRICU